MLKGAEELVTQLLFTSRRDRPVPGAHFVWAAPHHPYRKDMFNDAAGRVPLNKRSCRIHLVQSPVAAAR